VLARRKLTARSDAGREWVEGETVRVRGISNKSSYAWPAGESLQVCDTIRRSRAEPVLLSPAGRSKAPLALRSNPRRHPQGNRRWLADRADTESDSGVPESDDGNVRGRHGTVKAPQGPRKATGSPHPRRSKRRRSRGAPHRDRPKLTTANSFVDPLLL
jgi:hypothetical protein